MSGKLSPTFFLFSGALVLWCAAAALSSYLSGGPGLAGGVGAGNAASHRGAQATLELSPEVSKLRDKAEAATQAFEPHLEYANALREEAYQRSSSEYLMEAVREYSRVLEIAPDNAEALYNLASLCLEAGIVNKALEYYPRYLKLKPDDIRAKTDMALALLQASRVGEAREQLDSVMKANPEFVPARLTLALSYKVEGNLEKAKSVALEAKKLVKDDEAKGRIDEFVKALDAAPAAPEGSEQGHSHPAPENISPAGKVAAYFQNHQIVGPKLKGITWPELSVAQVALENFPVEQMPPFAKEKFIKSTQAALADLPTPIKVRLVDAASSRELLVIDVGGGSK